MELFLNRALGCFSTETFAFKKKSLDITNTDWWTSAPFFLKISSAAHLADFTPQLFVNVKSLFSKQFENHFNKSFCGKYVWVDKQKIIKCNCLSRTAQTDLLPAVSSTSNNWLINKRTFVQLSNHEYARPVCRALDFSTCWNVVHGAVKK